MGEQNWRTETNAQDYFTHEKKAAQLANRRPVQTATDLVGPGIGSAAVRLTDFNDVLATFNGFFSALPGALSAPNATESFVGYVVSDATLGGQQVFTGLTSGVRYTRQFNRSPTDPDAVGWTNWAGGRVPATVDGSTANFTTVGTGSAESLLGPSGSILGDPEVFDISDAGLRIRKQGVYTGHIEVGCTVSGMTGDLTVIRPAGATSATVVYGAVNFSGLFVLPFTVWATNGDSGITVRVRQTVATADFWWRYQCTRTGDAI